MAVRSALRMYRIVPAGTEIYEVNGAEAPKLSQQRCRLSLQVGNSWAGDHETAIQAVDISHSWSLLKLCGGSPLRGSKVEPTFKME